MDTTEGIINNINAFFVERLEFDAAVIKSDAQLKADLGMTSLDIQELKIFIKRTFGFMPERQDMLKLSTLSDLYNYIAQSSAN